MFIFVSTIVLAAVFAAIAMRTDRDVPAWAIAGGWIAVLVALVPIGPIAVVVGAVGAYCNGIAASSRKRDVATYALYGALFPLPTYIVLAIRGSARVADPAVAAAVAA
ncbi:MAG TPA: hypothetical protein VGM39_08775 [Kofleriaceae bacterium]